MLKLRMIKLKQTIVYILLVLVFISIGWFGRVLYTLPKNSGIEKTISQIIKPTPLVKYQIDNLSNTNIPESQIVVGDLISETNDYSTYKYSMQFSPDMSGVLKKVSGIINVPKGEGPFPVIVMFRGFVSQETYIMGTGTQPSAKVFAKNGYITIAPDFLGYGESDKEASDIFETRFQTWITAVVTLKSVSASKDQPFKVGSNHITVDTKNIFIWGHSNGGQVALTTLEITGFDYPTVLWAPVSMRFPASILYYIDEAEDGGKFLIDQVAKFNEIYNANNFSLTNYYPQIKAPIQINQGTADTAVPYWLTDNLNRRLKDATVSATYIKYSGANHNMRPSWEKVVESSLLFFNQHLK